ncbi:MAG: histidine phosphatase family protein [Planctomycetes bacterium]|nr:histidine phosphatase family protein [Planctomycetota bacterium]
MELLLLRHAKAVPQGTEGVSDADRPLTAEGARDAETLGRFLRRVDCIPGKIFSSPLLRARQTTGALLYAAGISAPALEFTEVLKPGCAPVDLQAFLTLRAGRSDRVLIVGHQPDLGRFIGAIMGLEEAAVQLATCAVARVDVERPDVDWSGYLVWLWTPETYSRLV